MKGQLVLLEPHHAAIAEPVKRHRPAQSVKIASKEGTVVTRRLRAPFALLGGTVTPAGHPAALVAILEPIFLTTEAMN